MSTTEPIRDKKELQKFMNYYKTVQPNTRNYVLIQLGLHSVSAIS